MHDSVLTWAAQVLTPPMIEGKKVLEAGAYNVNGSLRSMIERYKPHMYMGTDARPGPGVDHVIDAAALPENAADLVVSTEMLEHCRRWDEALLGMVCAVRPGGYLLLTTRSPGFGRHDHPGDYWRWTTGNMARAIVQHAGLELVRLQPDPDHPGVFVLAQREEGSDPGYMPVYLATAI